MFNKLCGTLSFSSWPRLCFLFTACPRIWGVYFPFFILLWNILTHAKVENTRNPYRSVPVVSKWSVLLHLDPHQLPTHYLFFWFVSFSILYFLSWFSNTISYKKFKHHKCTKQRMWQPSIIPHSSDNNHCSQFGIGFKIFSFFAVNILYNINNHI